MKNYDLNKRTWGDAPKKRWHHEADKWTRGNMNLVLFRNPALAAALELLGIQPDDLAAKAEERENRRRPYEERNNMLSAHAQPDKRVGPAQSTRDQINRGGGERPAFKLYDEPKPIQERKVAKKPLRQELKELMEKHFEMDKDTRFDPHAPIVVERACHSSSTIPRHLAGRTTLHVGQAEIPAVEEGVCVESRTTDLEVGALPLGMLSVREDEIPSE